MKKTYLKEYARLLVRSGISVKKGDIVIVNAGLDQPEFVEMVVAECYRARAAKVLVEWSYLPLTKLNVNNMSAKMLGTVEAFEEEKLKYRLEKNPAMLYLTSDDPDGLKGVNQKKMAAAMISKQKVIKPYRDQMDNKYKWCIAAVPGAAWAKKLFPKDRVSVATEKLWNAILYNEERFVLMDEGSFWINDEVKKPGLASGAMDKRICSWVELFDKYTGGSLVVASAQLDHASDLVKQTELGQLTRSLKGVLGKRYNSMPVYLALDLKSDVDGDIYFDMIANRGFDDARGLAIEDKSEGFGSNHFFGNAEKGREECFWFAREYGEVLSYEVINSKYKGKNDTEAGFVSDHYGILLTIGALK
jgi:hypothetical protein